MVAIPFLPMAMGGGMLAVMKIQGQATCCGRLGWTLLSLLLAIPAIGLATPAYIAYVLYKGLRKVADPGYDVGFAADMKSYEITIESALQTCLGDPPPSPAPAQASTSSGCSASTPTPWTPPCR